MKKHVLLIAVLLLFPALLAHGQDINGIWRLTIVEGLVCRWDGDIELTAPTNPGLFNGTGMLKPAFSGSCGNRSGSLEGGIAGSALNMTFPTRHMKHYAWQKMRPDGH